MSTRTSTTRTISFKKQPRELIADAYSVLHKFQSGLTTSTKYTVNLRLKVGDTYKSYNGWTISTSNDMGVTVSQTTSGTEIRQIYFSLVDGTEYSGTITVTATDENGAKYVKTVTVSPYKDGDKGTDAVSMALEKSAILHKYNASSGNSYSVIVRMYDGTTQLVASKWSATCAVSISSGSGLTASFSSGPTAYKLLMITVSSGASPTGTVTVTGTYGDYTYTSIISVATVEDGTGGDNGRGITSADVVYVATTSGTTAPADTANWKTTFDELNLMKDAYVWTATKITYDDDTTSYTGKRLLGPTSDFVEVTEQYAISISSTTAPTDGWDTTYTAKKGYWLWTRSKLTYDGGGTGYSDPVCTGYFGVDGTSAYSVLTDREVITYKQGSTTTEYKVKFYIFNGSSNVSSDSIVVEIGGVDLSTSTNSYGSLDTGWYLIKKSSTGTDDIGDYLELLFTFDTSDEHDETFVFSVTDDSGDEPVVAGLKTVTVDTTVEGEKGVGISSADVMYRKTSSGTTVPDDTGWNTTYSFSGSDQGGSTYVWTCVKITYTEGSGIEPTYSGKQCLGEAADIVGITEVYALGTSGTESPADTEWSETVPEAVKGYWLWTASRVNWSDGVEYRNKYCAGYLGNDGMSFTLDTYSIVHKNTGESGYNTYSIKATLMCGGSVVSPTFSYGTLPTNVTLYMSATTLAGVRTYTFRIAKNSTAEGTFEIYATYNSVKYTAKVSVKTILDGTAGERGAVLRGPNDWSSLSTDFQFYSGASGEPYIDIIEYESNYFECKTSHLKSSTSLTPDNDSTNWQQSTAFAFVATKILLAEHTKVTNLVAEYIEMLNENNEVVFKADKGDVECNTGTFNNVTVSGTVTAEDGKFGCMTIDGDSHLTLQGTDDIDPYLDVIDSIHSMTASMGHRQASLGYTGEYVAGYFANLRTSSSYPNTALELRATGGTENTALRISAGNIRGFALKPLIVTASKSLDFYDASSVIICNSSSNITVTLPAVSSYNNGLTIKVRAFGSGRVTISPYSGYIATSAATYSGTYHIYQGYSVELTYVNALTVNSTTGAWVVTSKSTE